MRSLSLAVMALCAANASARIVVLQVEAAFHTDQWCADHHLGEGPSTCIQHSGCCYDGRIGICHSCDAHSDEWCATYGGEEVKTCVGYSGCTFSYEKEKEGKCVSNADPADFELKEVTCEEEMEKVMGEAGLAEGPQDKYIPQCDAGGGWKAQQSDAASGFEWCVDENGHEIPDTRAKGAAFKAAMTNCAKEQKKHAGQQCPNSVTLSTGNGEVMINDHEDVGNCDMTCNTDKDCGDDEWCCYNGCGYSCQIPIVPKADCETLVLEQGVIASNFAQVPTTHGTEVDISCANGWFGSDPVQIQCKHGSWDEYEMQCFKDCPVYRIVDGRERDYEIKGNGFHHESTRKVSCVNGYGAISGSPDAMRFSREKVTCVNGAWTERTLECSSCYDAPSEGPNGWWTGIEDGSKRADSFDCLYFASRPLKCSEFKEAQQNCRISCRTCEAMLMKYKIKAVRDNIEGVKWPSKWLPTRLRFLVGFQNEIMEDRRMKVAKRRKKDGTDTKKDVEAQRIADEDAKMAKEAEAQAAQDAKDAEAQAKEAAKRR